MIKGAATVDDCYDVLALYGTKIPTQDQVRMARDRLRRWHVLRQHSPLRAVLLMPPSFHLSPGHPLLLQVKHDDLRESVAKLVEQLEGCTAYAEEQRPAHLDSLRATAKGVLDEAILLEESLKVGWQRAGVEMKAEVVLYPAGGTRVERWGSLDCDAASYMPAPHMAWCYYCSHGAPELCRLVTMPP